LLTGHYVVELNYLPKNRVQWQAVVNVVMNLGASYKVEFLIGYAAVGF
jgi:hypothetical protein